MRQRIEYMKGDTIGNCLFLEEKPTKIIGNGRNQTTRRVAKFKCVCGNEFEALLLSVKYGITTSCGCIRKANIKKGASIKNRKHGKREHPLYKVWNSMNRRCSNPNDFGYHNYGGRGIKVCEEWKNINNFIDDMYPSYSKGLEIDRINTNGNYEPGNCRWVTRKQNMNNIRRNRIIEYKGNKKTVSEWSDYLNIPYKRLLSRLNHWDIEKSFTYKK